MAVDDSSLGPVVVGFVCLFAIILKGIWWVCSVMWSWECKSYVSLQQKFGWNCSLCDFVDAVFPTLTKQTILPIIQKRCPSFSYYILTKNLIFKLIYLDPNACHDNNFQLVREPQIWVLGQFLRQKEQFDPNSLSRIWSCPLVCPHMHGLEQWADFWCTPLQVVSPFLPPNETEIARLL